MSLPSTGFQSSSPDIQNPFGGLPFQIAGNLMGSQANPLIRQLGYQHGRGPLASAIGDIRGFAPDFINQFQNLGAQLSGLARGAYGNFSSQLPDITAAGRQGLNYAQQSAEQAFSPLANRAVFAEASRRALEPAQGAASARGILQSGAAQQGEQDVRTNLATNFAQNELANQQAAIQGLGGQTQLNAGLSQLGLNVLPGYASLLSGAANLPAQGASTLLGLLGSGNTLGQNLLGLTRPTYGQSSKGMQFS